MSEPLLDTRWPGGMAERMDALRTSGTVDVVIIGAGVNGAGLFRDLCAQGLTCLIIDKSDYGSGTSAAPSRLIHGGLKYLETGELRLVAQSTYERNLLLRNAPHYVKPLATVIPIFSWTKGVWSALRTLFGAKGTPRSRGALLIKTGLSMYDFYGARQRVMPRHSMAGKAASLKSLPALTPRIVATGTYYDATVTHPERLVAELVRDGLALSPSSAAVNHARLETREFDTLVISSLLNGARTRIKPRLVVNAGGPWIDTVNATLGEPSRMIGGTKGSHILLRNDALLKELDGRMIYFEADDGRICLVFDYLGRAMVGSTDIKADQPDRVRCEDDEIDYLLDSLSKLLPKMSFDRSQIVYTYSGIRPLPANDAKDPGLISRDHVTPVLEPIGDRPFPVLSLVGGKWTTFRGYAEEVANTVLQRLGRSRRVSTEAMAIGGGREYPADPAARARMVAAIATSSGLDTAAAETLLQRYGTTAQAVGAHIARTSKTPLPDLPDHFEGEIDYLIRHEQVGRLADIVLRRTALAVTGTLTLRLLDHISEIAAQALDWDTDRRTSETAAVRDELSRLHGVTLS
jgi:glycerol-3-phosphate dehydrogenase